MIGGFFEIRSASVENEAAVAAKRENAARTAFSTHSFEIKGVGSVRLATVQFDTIFLDRPRVSMGASMLKPPDMRVWALPQVTGLVTKWVMDRKGHYTGAEVYGVVDIRRVDGEVPEVYPTFSSVLDVLFIGTAYKDVGAAVISKASTITVRPTGMGG